MGSTYVTVRGCIPRPTAIDLKQIPPPPPKKIKKHSECSKSLDVIGRLSVKQFDQFDQQLRTVKLSQ